MKVAWRSVLGISAILMGCASPVRPANPVHPSDAIQDEFAAKQAGLAACAAGNLFKKDELPPISSWRAELSGKDWIVAFHNSSNETASVLIDKNDGKITSPCQIIVLIND
jgi:hypothetical protein